MKKVMVIWLVSCGLYVVFGLVFCVVEHTGPHDWFHLPGITVEHYSGRGIRLDSVEPTVLLPSLVVSYLITWCLFWLASRLGRKRVRSSSPLGAKSEP